MHGQKNIKLCDAKQVYHYKNIKLKLYKNNAPVWFNKTCKAKHLTPTYASIKIKGDNPRCQKNKTVATRYRKKNALRHKPVRRPTNNLPPTVSSHSSCVLTSHQELS